MNLKLIYYYCIIIFLILNVTLEACTCTMYGLEAFLLNKETETETKRDNPICKTKKTRDNSIYITYKERQLILYNVEREITHSV